MGLEQRFGIFQLQYHKDKNALNKRIDDVSKEIKVFTDRVGGLSTEVLGLNTNLSNLIRSLETPAKVPDKSFWERIFK